MRYWIYTLTVLLFTCCNNSGEEKRSLTDSSGTDSMTTAIANDSSRMTIHQFPDSILHDKISAVLMKIPFVQKSNAYIDSFSHHQHGIAFLMDADSSNQVNVSAGYNGEQRFEPYYHFRVNAKTLEVKVYDPITDSLMTLTDFSKQQKEQ